MVVRTSWIVPFSPTRPPHAAATDGVSRAADGGDREGAQQDKSWTAWHEFPRSLR